MYDRHPLKPFLYWVKSVENLKKISSWTRNLAVKQGTLEGKHGASIKIVRNGETESYGGFHQNRAFHALARSMISDVKMDFYC